MDQNIQSKKKGDKFYDLWSQPQEMTRYLRRRKRLPPPKIFIPGHCESYNPPEEYLLNENEIERWKQGQQNMLGYSCIPKKFDNLRSVPNAEDYMQFISNRCLDLYSCPRVKVKKLQFESKDLVPKLKMPQNIDEYPIEEKVQYVGHKSIVKSIAIHPNGLWLASASLDKTVKVWNIVTGKCLYSIDCDDEVRSVNWIQKPLTSIVSFTWYFIMMFYFYPF